MSEACKIYLRVSDFFNKILYNHKLSKYIFCSLGGVLIICLHALLKQIAPVQTKGRPLAKDVGVVSTADSIFYFHSPHAIKCSLIARLHNCGAWPIYNRGISQAPSNRFDARHYLCRGVMKTLRKSLCCAHPRKHP